jgi:hypothetical protein
VFNGSRRNAEERIKTKGRENEDNWRNVMMVALWRLALFLALFEFGATVACGPVDFAGSSNKDRSTSQPASVPRSAEAHTVAVSAGQPTPDPSQPTPTSPTEPTGEPPTHENPPPNDCPTAFFEFSAIEGTLINMNRMARLMTLHCASLEDGAAEFFPQVDTATKFREFMLANMRLESDEPYKFTDMWCREFGGFDAAADGSRISFRSAGPDGVFGTADDLVKNWTAVW